MKKSIAAMFCALLLSSFSLSAQAFFSWGSSNDTYTETRYPIVLVHGLFGFDSILGVEYWYRIPEEIRRSGADVHVAQVSAANSTEKRGEQLARQVEEILAVTGAERVNLIGHSHGSPTARYVASVYPGMVASVTSVGGANHGSPLADVMKGVNDNTTITGATIETLGNALAGLIDLLSGGGNDQDIAASLEALTTEESERFTEHHPYGMPEEYCGQGEAVGANGVRYYSWTGTRVLTNALDISDPLLAATSLAIDGPSDGLVSQCSARLGKVIREDYRMNHLDQVNHVLGLRHLFETSPASVFRQHANRLKNQGL